MELATKVLYDAVCLSFHSYAHQKGMKPSFIYPPPKKKKTMAGPVSLGCRIHQVHSASVQDLRLNNLMVKLQ